MMQFLADNAGTILVCLVLAAAVVGIAVSLRRDRKKGKSARGCNCGCCPMAGSCHKES